MIVVSDDVVYIYLTRNRLEVFGCKIAHRVVFSPRLQSPTSRPPPCLGPHSGHQLLETLQMILEFKSFEHGTKECIEYGGSLTSYTFPCKFLALSHCC